MASRDFLQRQPPTEAVRFRIRDPHWGSELSKVDILFEGLTLAKILASSVLFHTPLSYASKPHFLHLHAFGEVYAFTPHFRTPAHPILCTTMFSAFRWVREMRTKILAKPEVLHSQPRFSAKVNPPHKLSTSESSDPQCVRFRIRNPHCGSELS